MRGRGGKGKTMSSYEQLNTILQGLIKRSDLSSIVVRKGAEQTLTKTYAKITIDTISHEHGDAFTVSNGGVVVNKTMRALVGGSLYSNGSLVAGDTVFVALYLNGELSATVCTQRVEGGGAQIFPIPICIMDLDEGDRVDIYAYNNVAARGVIPAYYSTRLTITEL